MLIVHNLFIPESYKVMMLHDVLYKHEIKWSAMR